MKIKEGNIIVCNFVIYELINGHQNTNTIKVMTNSRKHQRAIFISFEMFHSQ